MRITLGEKSYRLDAGIDLAIPLDFQNQQPNAYGVSPAKSVPYSWDGGSLDVRQGGSCNCDVLTVIPHCHGTHIECVGHVTRERFSVADLVTEPFLPATLATIALESLAIGASQIPEQCESTLVIRTRPNPESKKSRQWDATNSPFFTTEAMQAIRHAGVNHLLVDFPSLDPPRDEGKLTAHRIFWEMTAGSTDLPESEAVRRRTVTEMIFVPDEIPDGACLIALQYPRFVSDAAPVRPILYLPDRA